MVFYSRLLQDSELLIKVEEKIRLLKKLIGPDSLYAVITSEMKDFIDRFPDLVFIRNDRGTLLYGLYKGLRKLRGNDVLVIDPSGMFSLEALKEVIARRRKNLVHSINGLWGGIMSIRLIDLDYLIRTLENFLTEEQELTQVVNKVKEDYGIEYEAL